MKTFCTASCLVQLETERTLKTTKTRHMKSKPETIRWDLVSNTRQSNGTTLDGNNYKTCDAQFWTPRLPAWKDLQAEYPTPKWESIDHGEQMQVPGYMTLNLYNSGKVMVQGPHFKVWAKTEFTRLKNKWDGTSPPQINTPADSNKNNNYITSSSQNTKCSQTLSKVVDCAPCTPSCNPTCGQRQTTPLGRIPSKLSQFLPSGGQTSTPQPAHLSHLTDHGSAAEDDYSGPSTVSDPSSSYRIDSNNSSHSWDDSFTSEPPLPFEEITTPVTQETPTTSLQPYTVIHTTPGANYVRWITVSRKQTGKFPTFRQISWTL